MKPLLQYIYNTKKSLFRFEGLQDYSAEDSDAWVETFIKTGKLASYPDDTSEWWRAMKKRNKDGVITQRVRLVTEPLTDYTKMELAYLKEAVIYSGDDTRIINESDFKMVASDGLPDYWMVDDAYVFLMKYGSRGKHLGDELITGNDVQKYIEYRNELLKYSKNI